MSFLARWPGRASWGSLSLLDLIGAGGLAPPCTGAQDSPGSGGEGHLFWAEDASYLLHDDSDLHPRTLCAPPTVTQFPHFLPHLVHVFLQGRSIRQKLIVQPGLLHCLLHIVAEPQAVDDGLGWG